MRFSGVGLSGCRIACYKSAVPNSQPDHSHDGYLGHKQHDQGDVGGEDDGQRGKSKGGILLTVEDHGNGGRDETQHLG